MEFDATFFATVGLLIFLGLVVYLGVPGKMLGGLDAHADKVKTELDEARKLREEAQDLLASFQRKHEEAENEADQIISQAKRTAETLVLETEEKAKLMLARREQQVALRISQAEVEAVAMLRNSAANAAVDAAESLLHDSVTGSAASKLIDASVKSVTTNIN